MALRPDEKHDFWQLKSEQFEQNANAAVVERARVREALDRITQELLDLKQSLYA